jgi:hypothetical protein
MFADKLRLYPVDLEDFAAISFHISNERRVRRRPPRGCARPCFVSLQHGRDSIGEPARIEVVSCEPGIAGVTRPHIERLERGQLAVSASRTLETNCISLWMSLPFESQRMHLRVRDLLRERIGQSARQRQRTPAGNGSENKQRLGLLISVAEFANVRQRLFNGYSTTSLNRI